MRRIETRRRGGTLPRLGRKTRIAVLTALTVVVAGALAAYILAGRTPAQYRPAQLTPAQRDAAMRGFRRKLMDFSNDGQGIEPFEWSVTQDQLNAYLAAMDEIAVQGGAKPGAVREAMRSAGLVGPAVALDDGRVRLMARSVEYDRVVSVDIRLAVGDDGLLHVSLAGARVGRLPMPPSLVRSYVDRLRDKLARRDDLAESAPAVGGLSPSQVALVIRRVLSAIDGEPIAPEMSWKITARKRVRVRQIDIDGGDLTLHLVPIKPEPQDGRENR